MEKKTILKPKPKKPFLERNLKTIAIVFVILFLGQSMRGCVKSSSLDSQLSKQKHNYDSIISIKNNMIVNKDSVIEQKNNFIQYLEYELKIAGIKVQAADDRASAVQSTAEKVKNNTSTTIKIQGASKDTTSIKKL